MKRLHLPSATSAVLLAAMLAPVHAQSEVSSRLSHASALPVAVSITAPALLLSAGATLSIVAVETAADGVVWVFERASDGARSSVHLASSALGGISVGVGTVVTVSAVGAGWVLSEAGRAIAFAPNRIGEALLYNERVTP